MQRWDTAGSRGFPTVSVSLRTSILAARLLPLGRSTNCRQLVRLKLSAVRESVAGKRVVLVDDSIVRGTTSGRIAALLREAGAAEIHLRVSAPPFRNPCYYGTDIDSQENLIACRHSIEEIAGILGVDSLGYLPVPTLEELCGGCCSACFTGQYPTAVPPDIRRNRFEQKLSERRS